MGFWPEDQYDYSPEADAIRAKMKKEYDYYQANMKPDPVALTAKLILKNKTHYKPTINQPLCIDTLDQLIQEKTK